MALLATFLDTKTTDAVMRVASKAGLWAILAVVLVFFLMQQVLAGQHETHAMLQAHQTETKEVLRDQLEILRIICANLATTDATRSYCFAVGNQPTLAEPKP